MFVPGAASPTSERYRTCVFRSDSGLVLLLAVGAPVVGWFRNGARLVNSARRARFSTVRLADRWCSVSRTCYLKIRASRVPSPLCRLQFTPRRVRYERG